MSDKSTRPPKAYEDFVHRFPGLGEAWSLAGRAAEVGPLDPKAQRLAKLAIAIGALREGAIRSNVRKAVALGVTRGEVEQVLALAASTIGFPATVAVFTWIQPLLDGAAER